MFKRSAWTCHVLFDLRQFFGDDLFLGRERGLPLREHLPRFPRQQLRIAVIDRRIRKRIGRRKHVDPLERRHLAPPSSDLLSRTLALRIDRIHPYTSWSRRRRRIPRAAG